MSDTINIAKKLYELLDDESILSLGQAWDSEEIKTLIKGDVLRIISIIYVFSNREEREVIDSNLENVFDVQNARDTLVEILETFKIRKLNQELFIRDPYSVSLAILSENERERKPAFYLNIIQVLSLAIIAPSCQIASDIRLAILSTHIQCCRNRLANIGIEDKSIECSIPDIITLLGNIDYPLAYEPLQDEDAAKIFDKMITCFNDEIIKALIDDSKFAKPNADLAKRQIKSFIDKIDKLEFTARIRNILSGGFNIHINLESNTCEEDELKVDNSADVESEVIPEHSFDEVLDLLNVYIDDLNDYYGTACELRFVQDDVETEIKICGTIIECFKYINNYVDNIYEQKKFSIKYSNIYMDYYNDYRKDTFYCIENAATSIIRGTKIYIQRKEIERINSIKFDESVLPDEYSHFKFYCIDHSNYDSLWDGLKSIEKKYSIGLYQMDGEIEIWSDVDYNDWESECFFEQCMFLKDVLWTGKDISEEDVGYHCRTYRRLSKEQLKYYLYWKTNIRNGKNLDAPDAYKFIYMYELLGNIGLNNYSDRVVVLKRLLQSSWCEANEYHKGYYSRFGTICNRAIIQYERLFNLIDVKKLFEGDVTTWTHEWDYCAKQIHSHNYDHVFEIMNNDSSYHMYSGALNTRIPCSEYIIDCIKYIVPYISKYYADNGISFEEAIVGIISPVKNEITEAEVWTERIQKRLYANQQSNAFCVERFKYYSPAEYIIKYVENSFRSFFKTGGKLTTTAPAMHIGNNDFDEEQDIREDAICNKYIQIYDKINEVLDFSIKKYFEVNLSTLEELKSKYIKSKSISAPETQIPYEKKTPADELMKEYINQSTGNDDEFEHLLMLYDEASNSLKKSKASRFSIWIHDFWLLHNSQISYHELSRIIVNNKWKIEYISELQNHNYSESLPYLITVHDPCNGVMGKRYGYNVVADAIILVFSCLDGVFSGLRIDLSELLLGKFDKYDWVIYDTDDGLLNKSVKSIVKNLNNVEIYSYDATTKTSIVWRHSYDENARSLISYIIRGIDNYFRQLSGYTSYLKNEFIDESVQGNLNPAEAKSIIDSIISIVVRFVADYNKPVYSVSEEICEVIVTNTLERDYIFFSQSRIDNISQYVEKKIRIYYGLAENIKVEASRPYDFFSLDLDTFNISDYTFKYKDRNKISQKQPAMMLYSFRENYFDTTSKLNTVKSTDIEYNPSFYFVGSKVMKTMKGLINKDINVLSGLSTECSVFKQWIEWANNGCFVFAKNEPYVQIFFYFMLNDWIMSDNHLACLVMMSRIFNYYFEDKENIGAASDLYLSWIKDYYILYCSRDISYEEFKSLFIYDIEFSNENKRVRMIDHFFVNMNGFDECNLLPFYNRNCDYQVMDGLVVTSGYKGLLEDALERVHDALNALWNSYGLDFISFFNREDVNTVKRTREIFYRAVLTHETKKKITAIKGPLYVSAEETYTIAYDYENSWPVFRYEIDEISNISSRYLLEYIVKLTEKGVREWLNMPYNFKIDERRLYEAFPNKLFEDNIANYIIETTIMDTVLKTCMESQYPCKNPKLLAAQNINDDLTNNSYESQFIHRLEHMKYAANTRQAEYDHIERGQSVDKESIEKAREVLRKNQERLVVEEEEIVGSKVEEQGESLLSEYERDLLLTLLNGDDISAKVSELESRFISVSLLIESINNKAIEVYGDIAIEDEYVPSLIDDYLDEIEQLLDM